MNEELRNSTHWKSQTDNSGALRLSGQEMIASSFSGHERNRLFVSGPSQTFTDLSALSGLDTPADSRSWAILDYDHDTFPDVALVNSNGPTFNLFRNQIGERTGSGGHAIAVRVWGANRRPAAVERATAAPRDGYGAIVTVALGSTVLRREFRCGEGFAAQNSRTMLIGIGSRETADKVTVRWPSGKTRSTTQVAAGKLVVAFEDPGESADDSGFDVRPYRAAPRAPVASRREAWPFAEQRSGPEPFHLYLTMATWCEACTRELPRLAYLRSRLAADRVAFHGIPIDPEDTPDKLAAYAARNKPSYQLLESVSADDIKSVNRLLKQRLLAAPVPCTVVTDRAGQVLGTFAGLPSFSEVQRAVESVRE